MARREILAALAALAFAGAAKAQAIPTETHMQAYRDRLALYQQSGFDQLEILTRMKNYFPGFGVRFGIDRDRADTPHYYVALGSGAGMTFYATLN